MALWVVEDYEVLEEMLQAKGVKTASAFNLVDDQVWALEDEMVGLKEEIIDLRL